MEGQTVSNDCGTCDMAEATGAPVDCALCPCSDQPVDLIGDELREASADELADLIGLD